MHQLSPSAWLLIVMSCLPWLVVTTFYYVRNVRSRDAANQCPDKWDC